LTQLLTADTRRVATMTDVVHAATDKGRLIEYLDFAANIAGFRAKSLSGT
jgi:hypothetical protein